ncbi:hypothetical protein C8J57DRAFT_46761 [Mycena rebaudengoi]|nr:hypothetical protein C8J57DRAFT_46761 [Mycena rebaudengoi]
MSDPITIATTIITLATFIKDLIDIGQNIKRSIEKVGENRRRVREFTEEILRMLSNLGTLCGDGETVFQKPELLFALGELKADMIHVLSIITKFSSAERRQGLRAFPALIKVWLKRDDIELEIKRLKEHVNKCCTQFTTLSVTRIEQASARIEDTSVRVEQRLIINNVEHQVKLERLQSMMTRMLVQSQFGHDVVSRTMEIVTSDPNHRSIESQFLSLQTMRFINAFEKYTTTHYFRSQTASWDPVKEPLLIGFLRPKSNLHILQKILQAMLQIKDHPTNLSMKGVTEILLTLGGQLVSLGMESEATASDVLAVQVFRHLASGENFVGCVPRLAFALQHLSHRYQYQLRHESAVQASEQSVYWCHVASESAPDVDNRALLLTSLNTHSANLCAAGQTDAAISVAREALIVCRALLPETFQLASAEPDWALLHPEKEFQASECARAFFCLSSAFSDASRHREAYMASKEGLEIVARFSGSIPPPSGSDIDTFFYHMCEMAEAGEFEPDFLADTVILYGNLSRIYPQEFSNKFLHVLYAHAYFSEHDASAITNLESFLEPSWDSPPPLMNTFSTSTPWIEDWVVEHAIGLFYASQTHSEFDAIESFIAHLIQTHFDMAILVLREQVAALILGPVPGVIDWHACYYTVNNASRIFMELARPQRLLISEVLDDLVTHSKKHVDLSPSSPMNWIFDNLLWRHCRMLWKITPSCIALAAIEESVYYNQSRATSEMGTLHWLGFQALVLADMGRFSEAEAILRDAAERLDSPDPHWLFTVVESFILRQTGRKPELAQLLHEQSASAMKICASDSTPSDWFAYFLFTDLSSAQLEAGQTESALETAKGAVAKCQGLHSSCPGKVEPRLAVAHALIGLSNCLAACGRADEGLGAAQEAAAIYAGPPWQGLCPWGYRPQEFSSKALHTLSLRLAASGRPDEALINAEKAVEEYRELVFLTVRHTPSLANGLRNLASRFWDVGRLEESVATLKEAVSFLREVVGQQPYHSPTLADALEQLAEYLSARGDLEGSSTAASECALIRARLAQSFVAREREAEVESNDEFWDGECARIWERLFHSLVSREGEAKADCDSESWNSENIPRGVVLATAAQTESTQDFQEGARSPFEAEEIPLLQFEGKPAGASVPIIEPETSPAAQEGVALKEQVEMMTTEKVRDIADVVRFQVNIEFKSPPFDVVGWILLGISGLAWAGLALAFVTK